MLRRSVLLIFAPFYFSGIGQIFHLVTEQPLFLCLALTLLGSLVISAVIVFFAAQMTGQRSHGSFSLASIFALIVPISLYLAAFRILFQRISGELNLGAQISLLVFAFVAAACHTALLLLITEAFVHVTLRLLQSRRYARVRTRR
jgi:hypothetical protein